MISMVAAVGECNTLGKEGRLLWNLPHDLQHFKRLTLGHPVIMGRKTFETLDAPLPNRTNIIVTRQKDYKAEGAIVTHTLEDAIKLAKEVKGSDEICIVGGGEIYKLGLAYADKIELTRIHHQFEGGDAFFPDFDLKEWRLIKREFHPADERHQYSFTYQTFVR